MRDYLLGRAGGVQDLDVVVAHSAIPVARRVADRLGWAFYPLDGDRDVARLIFTASSTPLVCDVAAMRGGPSRPTCWRGTSPSTRWPSAGGARRLDVVDLTGGRADIERRLLRRVTPTSLVEDPVRLLRAVRLAVQMDFSIEPETLAQILRMADTVRLASPERVRDELWRTLLAPQPDAGIRLLRQYSLLRPLLPEIADMEGVEQSSPHDADVFEHTLRVVQAAAEHCGTGCPVGARRRSGRRALPQAMAGKACTPWLFRLRQHFHERRGRQPPAPRMAARGLPYGTTSANRPHAHGRSSRTARCATASSAMRRSARGWPLPGWNNCASAGRRST